MRVCFGAEVCPRRFADATGPPCMAAGRMGAHHAASVRRTSGFRIDVRIGVHGVVHLPVLELRRQGRSRSGGHRPIWLRTALLRPRQPWTVGQRCGAAHPHVEAPQGWSGMHRARRPFRVVGLPWRLEPLPGQRPAVHAVPAGQTVPGIRQAGMHRITRGQHQQTPRSGEAYIVLAGVIEVRGAVGRLGRRGASSIAGVPGPPDPRRDCSNPVIPRSRRPTPAPWLGERW